MIQQTLFPFNMEITNDKLTSKAGLSKIGAWDYIYNYSIIINII